MKFNKMNFLKNLGDKYISILKLELIEYIFCKYDNFEFSLYWEINHLCGDMEHSLSALVAKDEINANDFYKIAINSKEIFINILHKFYKTNVEPIEFIGNFETLANELIRNWNNWKSKEREL